MTTEIEQAYAEYNEVHEKYGFAAGYYDRSHGDNIRIGKRYAKLVRLIEAAGLDVPNTLAKLASK